MPKDDDFDPQLQLFHLTDDADHALSHSIEIFDAVPWISYGKNNRSAKLLDDRKGTITLSQKRKFDHSITPGPFSMSNRPVDSRKAGSLPSLGNARS
ncbi:MAG: hypothetical protein KZQ66_04295 [Candidatus Thiodiazotropha sp. (ex Lucinoma aequizonata)]|nr:hypothetical protein [Candidatus Thiodiazotropha sp. (ex Lucinoma aequizonata)]MCU7889069.1 hypothetical protein [Candidatus Thiodiazotropha sp. (ex Lucinoma aequizonata)]MCU7897079.1 hypothetical protein [Candidatus Thiodiazotropha sp. (ex Lucinoma aequizonata)]MCU7900093.1 hypothetical protein [Candidatus Thiodiazotropha sp. (ex Lucinoma aequizonata)]MCU7901312.1 hypothetical protein [Candidatus Thiodiazotropha sp. (ex Lucinoma aequizonata)]